MGCEPSNLLELRDIEMDINITQSQFITGKLRSIFDEYQFLSVISRNDQSYVRRVKNKKSTMERIVKVYNRNSKTQYKALNQINTLKELDHPNIIKLIQYFIDEKSIYLVFQSFQGTQLFNGIFGIKEQIKENFKLILKQIIKAVQYLHNKGYSHRNLTHQNILIRTQPAISIKIIGFSQTVLSKEQIKFQIPISDSIYHPPEKHKEHLEKGDIWMIGIIALLIIGNKTISQLSFSNLAEIVSHQKNRQVKQLLKGMLDFDPEARFSASQCLEKPILKNMANKYQFKLKLAYDCLKNFQKKIFLRQVFNMYCIHRFSSSEQQIGFINEFNSLDSNNNGVIERSQIVQSLMKCQNMSKQDAQLRTTDIFKRIDKNNNESIEFSEFMLSAMSRRQDQSTLQKIFKQIDSNQDGIISAQELKNAFPYLEIDQNINYQEFKKLMMD